MHVNPYDGYRAALHDNAVAAYKEILVWCRLHGENLFEPRTVAWLDRNPAGDSEGLRRLEVLQALCRYINSGGEIGALLDSLQALRGVFEEYQFTLPADWQLTVMGPVDTGFQIIFHNTQQAQYLVVVEDVYAEFLDDVEMGNELERIARASPTVLQPAAGLRPQAAAGRQPALPGPAGDGADGGGPEDPAGGAEPLAAG